MALLDSVQARLTTDFALLLAEQEPGLRPDAYLFATSTHGAVGMSCGTRYADVAITAERWDAPPPLDLRAWEDRDELPFEEKAGAGPLMLGGFEPADAPGLHVEGLGRARVRVLANGRHHYSYGDPGDREPLPEQWLLQLWPDPAREDALAGEPRRLAAPWPRGRGAGTPWQAALRAWRQAGWDDFVHGLDAFSGIVRALGMARHPVPLAELVDTVRMPRGVTLTLDTPLAPRMDAQSRALTQLGSALGIDIVTVGELLDALLLCGLLARTHDGRILPNPAPTPVWDLLDLDEQERRSIRLMVLGGDFGGVQWDLAHLVRWAPEQVLHATPRTIALRLAVPISDVLGGLELLHLRERVEIEPDVAMWTADDAVTASRPHR